jgi:hypothetical protein
MQAKKSEGSRTVEEFRTLDFLLLDTGDKRWLTPNGARQDSALGYGIDGITSPVRATHLCDAFLCPAPLGLGNCY